MINDYECVHISKLWRIARRPPFTQNRPPQTLMIKSPNFRHIDKSCVSIRVPAKSGTFRMKMHLVRHTVALHSDDTGHLMLPNIPVRMKPFILRRSTKDDSANNVTHPQNNVFVPPRFWLPSPPHHNDKLRAGIRSFPSQTYTHFKHTEPQCSQDERTNGAAGARPDLQSHETTPKHHKSSPGHRFGRCVINTVALIRSSWEPCSGNP